MFAGSLRPGLESLESEVSIAIIGEGRYQEDL